jgi:hypothetical protein
MTGTTPPPAAPIPSGSTGSGAGAGAAGTGSAAPAPIPVGEATLEQLPEKLRNLLRTIVLTGTIAELLDDGAVKLRTQMGEVTVRLPATPAPDRPLSLQILPGNPPTKAQVFVLGPPLPAVTTSPASLPPGTTPAVPGTVLTPPPPQTAPPAPGTVIPTTIAAMPPAAPPGSLQPLGTTPQAPAPAPPPAASGPPAAASGSPFGFPASAASQPVTPPAPQQATAPLTIAPAVDSGFQRPLPVSASAPATPQPQAPAQAPEAISANPAPGPMPLLKPGLPVDVRIVSLPAQAGHEQPAAPPQPSAASGLPATVTGTTTAGQPILTTDRGVVVLQAKLALPPGAQVMLSVTTPTAPPAAPFDSHHGHDWPALREALDVMAKADPAATRTLAETALPQPNGRLAATLASFVNHVRDGDIAGWLGDKAPELLEASGRSDLTDRLEDDFGKLTQQAKEPLPGEWRAYSIPMFDGMDLDRLRFLVRDSNADDEDANSSGRKRSGGASRFLIDLELSRMGEMQLDGLVHKKRFDLILRTRNPMTAEMRQDIKRIFVDAVDSLGMSGVISFSSGTQGWVSVPAGPSSGSVGIVA